MEHPILFSTPMVKAILDGKKTMTRRVIKPQPENVYFSPSEPDVQRMKWKGCTYRPSACAENPYGQVGDRLWVRETWFNLTERDGTRKALYKADFAQEDLTIDCGGDIHNIKWQSSMFMPRWASRITLEITNIRVERLQEISHEDVIKEGCPECAGNTIPYFQSLWDSINAKHGYSWGNNPWVWVIEFKLIQQKVR